MKSWFRDPLSRKLFKGIYRCDFWVSLKLTSNRKPGSSIFCSKTNPFRLIFTYCDHVFVANIFPSTKFWATKIMTHWRVFLHQIPFFHKQDVGPIIRTCHCVKQAYYIHCQWACTALSGNCLKHLKILKSLFLMFVPHLLYFFILFFVHVHVGPMDRATCVMASPPPPPQPSWKSWIRHCYRSLTRNVVPSFTHYPVTSTASSVTGDNCLKFTPNCSRNQRKAKWVLTICSL